MFQKGDISVYSVYIHTNLINGKKYIGITKRKPEARWNNGKGYRHNEYFSNSIEKYGWNNFSHEIIYTNLTEDEACLKEQELIKLYKSNQRDFGYNLESGGRYCNISEETKNKISKSLKGHCVSNKTKNKIRNTERGKKLSIDTKEKLSKANIERFKDPLERYKCGNGTRGKNIPHSKEHNRKVSEALKNKKYIHKDNEQKYIKIEELDLYFQQGWTLGKLTK